MKLLIKSEVVMMDMVWKHEHVQEFEDGTNVFGKMLQYHQYMYKTFPNCPFKLISTKEIKEGGKA